MNCELEYRKTFADMMILIQFQAVQLRDFTPGVTAIQVRFHPAAFTLLSVWKNISTVLVLVVIVGGWKYKEEDGSPEE